MIYGITYSDEKMILSAQRCADSMRKNGVDGVEAYNPNFFINERWYFENSQILDNERGSGLWLWKPYIIFQSILLANGKVQDGDLLIYSDAGIEFVAPVSNIINRMDQDIFFFTNGFPQVEWCKGDVLKIINWGKPHEDSDDYELKQFWEGEFIRSYKQVQASVIFFKVNQNTRNFVKEWLLYCQMPGFIDDSPSKLPNYPTFAEHRHDQAILTCLQIKYGYKLHWWPTQYSEHIRIPGDDYPVMFNHHRKRNNEW